MDKTIQFAKPANLSADIFLQIIQEVLEECKEDIINCELQISVGGQKLTPIKLALHQ